MCLRQHAADVARHAFPVGDAQHQNRLTGKLEKVHGGSEKGNADDADSRGLLLKEEVISITIPGGVGEGMQLSMSSKGNEMPGGIPGDLLIVIEEAEDGVFQREGNNVIYDLHISFIDAALWLPPVARRIANP